MKNRAAFPNGVRSVWVFTLAIFANLVFMVYINSQCGEIACFHSQFRTSCTCFACISFLDASIRKYVYYVVHSIGNIQ